MSRDDDQARIDRLLDLAVEGQGGSMDPNDLAQLASGNPSDETRAALEARLAAAPAADRELLQEVATDAAPAPSARRSWWLPVSAAAMVLAALGGALWLSRPSATPPLDDVMLARAFDALSREAPVDFEGVEPILSKERSESQPVVHRGGIRVFVPRGALRHAPPLLRWQAAPGAGSYTVRALSNEGQELFRVRADGTAMDWPAAATLEAGTAYVVTVSTLVSGVRARGSAAFRVLSAEDVASYERALDKIERSEPRELRPVLRAHLALRRGLVPAARRFLDAAPAEGAARALVQESRAYLDRLYGNEE